MTRISLVAGLVLGLFLLGCGSKKPEVQASASVGSETDAGADKDEAQEDALEPEADTGPMDVPEPPKRSADSRKPVKFKVWVKKAYVLPLSEDGRCWDACAKEAKESLIQSLSQLSGDGFGSQAKATATVMSAKGAKSVLPDLYLHIDCGFGQEYTTHRTSAEDRLAAKWRGAYETLKLDPEDQCAISVWDADEDKNDELLGATTVQIIKKAKSGEVILKGADEDMGQVFMIELFLDQLDGAPVWASASPQPQPAAPAAAPQPATKPVAKPAPPSKPSPVVSPPQKPATPGAKYYKVEVIKANLKKKKKDGQAWDTKIPFIGKGGTMPDPFVEVYVNGYQSENPFMQTSTAKETVYHEWRETGEAKLADTDKLHLMVWDKDKVDHDLMGECITDPVGKLKMGSNIVIRGCSQVDFIVVKVTGK